MNQQNYQMNLVVPLTPVVKVLLIANLAIWLVLLVIFQQYFMADPWITINFGLRPGAVINNFFFWQPLTYMFLHSLHWPHIVFNMLFLWWLGGDLEQRWGSRFFLLYYLVSGVGSAILFILGMLIYVLVFGGAMTTLQINVVGASGAIFGLMLAYGMLFGERVIYFLMLFPMKVKYFVLIIGAIEIVTILNSGVTNEQANLAHLGGIVSGYLFLKFWNFWQTRKWKKQTPGGRGRTLKLVVDNEKQKDPKYWN